MTIDSATGVINWTPTEAQGPGTYSITIIVTDDGSPPLSDSKTLSVSLSEVNSAPQIFFTPEWNVQAGTLGSFSVTASAPDLPAQVMTFSIDPGGPVGPTVESATRPFSGAPGDESAGTNNMLIRRTAKS